MADTRAFSFGWSDPRGETRQSSCYPAMITYLDRALQAARSAEKMREAGDYNAACNRAYYAIFYAAIGLLERDGDDSPGKTHASLLRRFSERFCASRYGSSRIGQSPGGCPDLRSKADYSVAGASEGDAADAISAMKRILEFARPRLISPKGTDDD